MIGHAKDICLVKAGVGVLAASLFCASLGSQVGYSEAAQLRTRSARLQPTTCIPQGVPRGDARFSAIAGSRSELFVAEENTNSINIYKKMASRFGGTLAGTITKGISSPFGVWIDRHRTLYVANYGSNTVTEYAPGSDTPMLTISQGVSLPWSVAVDSRGTLYVGSWSGPIGGYVDEYPAG